MRLLNRWAVPSISVVTALLFLTAAPLRAAEGGLAEAPSQQGGEAPHYQDSPKPKPVKAFSDEAPAASNAPAKVKKGKKGKRSSAMGAAASGKERPAKYGKVRSPKKFAPEATPQTGKLPASASKATKAKVSKGKKAQKSSRAVITDSPSKTGKSLGAKPKALKPKAKAKKTGKSGKTNKRALITD